MLEEIEDKDGSCDILLIVVEQESEGELMSEHMEMRLRGQGTVKIIRG